ncbi:PIN domain-containing protein [Xanthomonas sacchari]|uniref:PIN domain-containing protein n=1 Tax=Xanthomonas sacchari TaxID=56458 RepID=UPI00225E43B0|nr:PIN domain-containing protein [Xanthomonas sacchari]MCW0435123.1 hypothetical protein [Xanthomonas sacchari]
MDSTQRYALDTNFFLQVKAAEELPWRDLTNADRVELYLLDEVLGELDRHKSKGNSRTARRARNILRKLDPLIDGEIDELVVTESGPKVVWLLPPFLDPCRAKPPGLDVSTADGRIVEQAFSLQQACGNVIFLTHDRLPRRVARSIGLLCEKIPEAWLLDPEKDERDKEIVRLNGELKALSSRLPQVEVKLLRRDEVIDRIRGSICRYRPLSEEFLDDAVGVIENRFPEEDESGPGRISVTRHSELVAYQEARQKWCDTVRRRIANLPERLNLDQGLFELKLAVSNTGGAPADGLTLEVRLEGAMMLVNDRLKEEWFSSEARFSPPSPPKFPRFSSFEQYGRKNIPENSGLNRKFPLSPVNRDPQGFYWDYEGEEIFCKSARGSCVDFRHQVHKVELPIILCLPPEKIDPAGCLHVRWSARNMPKALERKYSIKLSIDWRESEESVGRLVIGGET